MSLNLFKRTSLLTAGTNAEVREILQKKAEVYNNSVADLSDYIGRAFNELQEIKNANLTQKAIAEMKIKEIERTETKLKENIALFLSEQGITSLKDKSADVLSSLSLVDEQEATIKTVEKKLSLMEMETILKLNGLETTKEVEITTEAKPLSLKLNYKVNKRVTETKLKDIKEQINKSIAK